jgi:hypothetical protein
MLYSCSLQYIFSLLFADFLPTFFFFSLWCPLMSLVLFGLERRSTVDPAPSGYLEKSRESVDFWIKIKLPLSHGYLEKKPRLIVWVRGKAGTSVVRNCMKINIVLFNCIKIIYGRKTREAMNDLPKNHAFYSRLKVENQEIRTYATQWLVSMRRKKYQ